MLNKNALIISKQEDISKTDCWKNVSFHISSLISNFFILKGEIFVQTHMRFLDICIFQMILDTEIFIFEISYFFNLAHACSDMIAKHFSTKKLLFGIALSLCVAKHSRYLIMPNASWLFLTIEYKNSMLGMF